MLITGRIYEVNDNYCLDLGRIISIRQYVDRSKGRRRRDLDCWVELTLDTNQIIEIDTDIDSLQDTYNTLKNAWRHYLFCKDNATIPEEIPENGLATQIDSLSAAQPDNLAASQPDYPIASQTDGSVT